MKTGRVKVRPLAPAEAKALELAKAAVKPMCDLFRMVPQEDWSPATLGTDGEMRKRFFEAEEALNRLFGTLPFEEALTAKSTAKALDVQGRKPLFAENERMRLGERGYSKEDIERIRVLASRFVEGRVLKGEVNPENDAELKAAVKKAGQEALQAYNAALEFVSG
jgi:hypothetical protein